MTDAEERSFAPKIDTDDPHVLALWADRLNTTPEELRAIIDTVGDNPRAVATELGVPLLD